MDTRKLKDLLRDLKRGVAMVPQAFDAMESTGTILQSVGKGKRLPKMQPPDPDWTPSRYDIEAAINGAIDKGVGYWRVYVRPRLRDLLK